MEVRRAADRFVTAEPGRTTHHSFSFGTHYDPGNVGLGALIAHNDDAVTPGHGYPDHPHRDLEILTWVLDGALTHRDSRGHQGVVVPGLAQAMSAGAGVVHSETVDPAAGPTRFIQAWVRPDEPGGETSYSATPIETNSAWTPLASGTHPDAVTRIRSRGSTLWIASLAAGEAITMPVAARSHLFVAQGAVQVTDSGWDPTRLESADAVRGSELALQMVAEQSTELMVWTFTS